jgi:hypothetical protein
MKSLLTSSLLLLLALAPGAASAEGVAVSLAGKSPMALHRDIVRAALAVCAEAELDFMAHVSDRACVAATVAKATAQVQAIQSTQVALVRSGR